MDVPPAAQNLKSINPSEIPPPESRLRAAPAHSFFFMNPPMLTPLDVPSVLDRRRFLRRAGLAAALFTVPGAFAEELLRTPAMTEGPFYPDHLPLDTDNDLIILNDSLTPAVGEVTYVSGRILDAQGAPLRGALVEIWQCDHGGAYLHSGTGNSEQARQELSGLRTFPHGIERRISFPHDQTCALSRPHPAHPLQSKASGKELLTTQCFIKGHPGNDRDGIWKRLEESNVRDSVTVDFAPIAGSKAGELAAKFDLILGVTPEA